MMDLPPETLLNNRYRVERLLGQGGMGSVYLAQDTALDTPVAVKANRSTAEHSTQQFLREARLLASLRHPHLPRVTDYFILDGVQYLVMDYVAGQDMNSLLKQEGAQPLERVLRWANQLGSALSYLHRQTPPVIHRDVKPANVRLDTQGDAMDAVLVDFGIAKVVDANQQTTSASSTGYTPGFAPPEQYGGIVRTGPYSDQYAFGALLYHLLSGQKPADSIQRALGSEPLVPLNQLVPTIPGSIQAAIEKALALRPEDRFASVDDFLRALQAPAAQAAAPLEQTVIKAPGGKVASSYPVNPDLNRPTPPPQAPVGPAGSSDPTLLASSGAASARTGSAAAEPAATASAARKPNWLLIGGIGLFALLGLAMIAVFAGGLLFLRAGGLPTKVAAATAPANSAAGAAAASASETPRSLSVNTPSAAPALPSETTAPSATLLPTNTDTPIPSTATQPPTVTPTPQLIGGGGLIAFASDRADGKTLQIWTMRVTLNDQGQAAALDLRQMTHSPDDKRQPAWSPDGKRLAYVAAGAKGKGQDIWVMNADGSGEPADLTHMAGDESQPAWSPDGRWIAFTSNGRSDGVLQIYLIRTDGSDFYRLSYDQEEYDPAWAPDGRLAFIMNASGQQIVFIRGKEDPKTGAAPTQEYYVTPVRFDQLGPSFTANLGQAAEPQWSADGQWIAYTRLNGAKKLVQVAHYPLSIPDKDVVKLTDTAKDSSPTWSPDGQWLAFVSERDDNPEIYLMRAAGQMQSNLSSTPGRDLDPAWRH